jgi:hypothetical protein
MVMVGQAKRLSEPARWGRREWRVLAATLAVVVVGSVVAALATSGGKSAGSSGRCVAVSIPSTTGAASLRECGAAARAWCQSLLVPGAAKSDLDALVLRSCAAEGFAPRRPSSA